VDGVAAALKKKGPQCGPGVKCFSSVLRLPETGRANFCFLNLRAAIAAENAI
jgi:hypothetical protein